MAVSDSGKCRDIAKVPLGRTFADKIYGEVETPALAHDPQTAAECI